MSQRRRWGWTSTREKVGPTEKDCFYVEYLRSVEDTVYIAGLLVCKVYGASPSAGALKYGFICRRRVAKVTPYFMVWNRPINIGPTGARPYGFTLLITSAHETREFWTRYIYMSTCHQNVRVQPMVRFHPPNLESTETQYSSETKDGTLRVDQSAHVK